MGIIGLGSNLLKPDMPNIFKGKSDCILCLTNLIYSIFDIDTFFYLTLSIGNVIRGMYVIMHICI